MATRYGYQLLLWLKQRGWKEEEIDEKDWGLCSDQRAIDPQTNQAMNVYLAAKLHKDRTDDSPDFLPKEYIDV